MSTPLGRALAGAAPSLFLIALALCVLVSHPLPAQAAQWQRWVLQWQLPDFEIQRLELATSGPHQVLKLQVVNRRYLVMQEQVVPPGTLFQAQTPARSGHLLAALLALAAAAGLWNVRRAWAGVMWIAVPAALALWLGTPTWVLAGSVWGLGVASMGELSLAALQVAAADFLLRGGGYFVVLLLALASSALGRR